MQKCSSAELYCQRAPVHTGEGSFGRASCCRRAGAARREQRIQCGRHALDKSYRFGQALPVPLLGGGLPLRHLRARARALSRRASVATGAWACASTRQHRGRPARGNAFSGGHHRPLLRAGRQHRPMQRQAAAHDARC